jgi:hypothetical protein
MELSEGVWAEVGEEGKHTRSVSPILYSRTTRNDEGGIILNEWQKDA